MRRTRADLRPGADLAAEAAATVRRATLGRSAALVYLTTPQALWLWVISPSGEVVVRRQPVSEDSLAVLVRNWRAGLGVGGADVSGLTGRGGPSLESTRGIPAVGRSAANDSGARLAALILPEPDLLARWADGTEIIVVPHGPLGLVPFAALPSGGSRLMGARFALRYAPSLSAAAEAEERPRSADVGAERPFRQAVVVGNPAMPSAGSTSGARLALPPLPGAAREAQQVAARLGATALTDAAASEQSVRRAMPDAPLVHLATHAYAYATPAMARQSFVALAPAGSDDGLLTVGEILDDERIRLRAELVVLSACQTGLGDVKEMEGTVGLQRAFLAKGARSLLVSLWSVSDEATVALMDGFYRHWLEDTDRPSKAEALRRAQGDVRATPGWVDPRYWAAFQLVGAR